MASSYLAVVESGGNQRYIFSTNRLRQNVGASHLIAQLAAWAKEAYGDPTDRQLVASSGRVAATFTDRASAEHFVSTLTRDALVKAPGLDVYGAVGEIDGDGFRPAWRRVQRSLERVRAVRGAGGQRFLRLPIMADCAVSHFPASYMKREAGRADRPLEDLSEVALAKFCAGAEGICHQRSKAGLKQVTIETIEQRLQGEQGWVAIIHADGSGVGALIDEHSETFEDYAAVSNKLNTAHGNVSVAEERLCSLAIEPSPEVKP